MTCQPTNMLWHHSKKVTAIRLSPVTLIHWVATVTPTDSSTQVKTPTCFEKHQLRWDNFRRKLLSEAKIKPVYCKTWAALSRFALMNSSAGEWRLFSECRSRLLGGLSCNRRDAKWSAVWRGHLRPEHLDNELRCNPKLKWTAVYPPRSPSLVLSHQSPLSHFIRHRSV